MRKKIVFSVVSLLIVIGITGLSAAQDLAIEVFTDKAGYTVGQDAIEISAAGQNLGPDVYVDVHIAIVAPDGAIYEMSNWNTDLLPMLSDVLLPEGFEFPKAGIATCMVGDIGFPASFPGDYLLAGVFTEPTTLDFLCDVSLAPFKVQPPATPQEGFISHDGLSRRFVYYLPNDLPSSPVPLVFMLHGAMGIPENSMFATTEERFNRLADRDKAIVVYPQSVSGYWNNCYVSSETDSIDDVGFISSLIDHFASVCTIDTHRVYAAGYSNGGMMSFRLAVELSDRIAAVASCNGPVPVESECSAPVNPLGVLYIGGTDDPVVPFDGSDRVMSAEKTVDFWVDFLEADATPSVIHFPDTVPEDGCTVTAYTYGNGRDQTQVSFYRIDGGGHPWPTPSSATSALGNKNRDISACDEIWSFFSKHTLGAVPGE